jgi:hypothetical protein
MEYMLKGKKVKTNDVKMWVKLTTLGKRKCEKRQVLDSHAYDGKTLWLLIDEGEILSKYRNGSESPPAGEQYASEFDAFKKTPYGQKAAYGPDPDQNVRVFEDYKNVRDLK